MTSYVSVFLTREELSFLLLATSRIGAQLAKETAPGKTVIAEIQMLEALQTKLRRAT